MKKVLLLLVCLFTLQTVVWADDDKPIQVNQLIICYIFVIVNN